MCGGSLTFISEEGCKMYRSKRCDNKTNDNKMHSVERITRRIIKINLQITKDHIHRDGIWEEGRRT